MARTYRRKDSRGFSRFQSLEYACSEWALIPGYSTFFRIPMDPKSAEYRKARAIFHSDKTSNFKEPGPSWFRNMFTERPTRRLNKRELHRFTLNPDYEPMVFSKHPLEYWT